MKVSIIIPVYNAEQWIVKCLDSIVLRDDIEIIVIDDASTDNSKEKIKQWIEIKNFKNVVFLCNEVNLDEGLTINRGLDIARGEYVAILDSDDDYLMPVSAMYQFFDGVNDLVYYNLIINNGERYKLTQETKLIHCGAVRFYKREFIGNTRRNTKKIYSDADFYYELLTKNPKEVFTDIDFYHYNFPRKDSKTGKALRGEQI